MEYHCNKCGMGVKNLTCSKCNTPLKDNKITTPDGKKVEVAECPKGCGKIKSPTCCHEDMVCSV